MLNTTNSMEVRLENHMTYTNHFLALLNRWMILLMCIWFTWPYFNYKLGVLPFLVFSTIWIFTTDLRWLFNKISFDLIFILLWILSFVPYILTGTFQYGFVDPTYILISFMLFICGMFINHYYMYFDTNRIALGRISFFSIVFFLVASIQTYVGLKEYPLAARGLATGSDPLQQVFISMGIGGFGFVYSAVFISILLLYFVMNKLKGIKKIYKYFSLFVYLMISTMIVSASYATSLLLLFIGTFLVITIRGRRSFIFGILLTILILLLFPKELIGFFLIDIAKVFNFNQVISTKFLDLAQMFIDDAVGSQTSGRFQLYLTSFETFIKNPLFGIYGPFGDNFNTEVGGHSGWFDLLAYYGLFGSMPLFISIFLNFRKQLRFYTNHPYFRYLLTTQVLFIIFGFINPITYIYQVGFVMFVIAPALPFLIDAIPRRGRSGETR